MQVGVIGASSYVGQCVIESLQRRGVTPIGFSRKARTSNQINWRSLNKPAANDSQIEGWITTAPIWATVEHLPIIASYGAQKIVAISSTSQFTKKMKGSLTELQVADDFQKGEERFAELAKEAHVSWIILRPTLIYGMNRDRNIVEIASIIKRFGFFPLFGNAIGKRQPVHARDVGEACVRALLSDASGKSYNISGGEVIVYREMVKRIFVTMNRRPVMPIVPLPVFRLACALINKLPRFSHWTPQMAERMNIDMAFDHADAMRDFGYSPAPFLLSAEDLPT